MHSLHGQLKVRKQQQPKFNLFLIIILAELGIDLLTNETGTFFLVGHWLR